MLREIMAVCLAAAALTLGVVGCTPVDDPAASTSDDSQEGSDNPKQGLEQLRAAYMDYLDANRQGPPNWDALLDFAAEREMKTDAIQGLRDAGYEVQWGASPKDATDGIGNFVVAESPQGGPKLMLDGSITE